MFDIIKYYNIEFFFQYKYYCFNVDDIGFVSDEFVEKLMIWEVEYQRGKILDEFDVCSDYMRSLECVIKEENMLD